MNPEANRQIKEENMLASPETAREIGPGALRKQAAGRRASLLERCG